MNLPAQADFVLSASPHLGTDSSVYFPLGAGRLKLGNKDANGLVYPPLPAIIEGLGYTPLNHAFTASALKLLTSFAAPVMRDDVGVIYTDTGASCLAEDGGSQIQSAPGHCWLADVTRGAPITLWGAVADDATDVQPAAVKGVAALAAMGGGRLVFPQTKGCWLFKSTLSDAKPSVKIEGQPGGSCVDRGFASGAVFLVGSTTGSGIQAKGVYDITFKHSTTATSGADVQIVGTRNAVAQNITCKKASFQCVAIDNGVLTQVNNIQDNEEGQAAIAIGCNYAGIAANITINAGNINYQHRSAVEECNSSGVTFIGGLNTDFNQHGLWKHPGTNQVSNGDELIDPYFDSSFDTGVLVDASGGGIITGNTFHPETWIVTCGATVAILTTNALTGDSFASRFSSGSTSPCLAINGSVTGSSGAGSIVQNQFKAYVFNAAGDGVVAAGGRFNDYGGYSSDNCRAYAPTDGLCSGFKVRSGTTDFTWDGRAGGPSGIGRTNADAYAWAIENGFSNGYTIRGDGRGTQTGALFDGGTGAIKNFDGMLPLPAFIQGKNLVINGNFSVNQRAYASGGSVAAGATYSPAAFFFDHWYNPASGPVSYTFTAPALAENQASASIDTTLTIPAGGAATQKIEERSIAGGVYSLNCLGTATFTVLYIDNSSAKTAATGTCASAVTAVIPPGVTVVLQFAAAASSSATLGLVEFDASPIAKAFERQSPQRMLGDAQRYFQIAPTPSGAWTATNTVFTYGVVLPVVMRATPVAALLAAGNGVTDPGTANFSVTGVNGGYTSLNSAGGYIGLGTAASTAYRPGIVQQNLIVDLAPNSEVSES